MAIKVHIYIIAQQPLNPLYWIILVNFWEQFYMPIGMIGIKVVMEAGKKKRLQFPQSCHLRKQLLGNTNNPLMVFDSSNKSIYR